MRFGGDRGDVRLIAAATVTLAMLAVMALRGAPAESAVTTVDVGDFYFGSGTISVTAGDQVRFSVSEAGNGKHTIEIDALGIHQSGLGVGSVYTTPVLTQTGTFEVYCKTHQNRPHRATLIVSAATTTTTTPPPTTTTTTTVGPTTTTTTTTGPTTTTTTTTTLASTTTTTAGATTTTLAGGTTTTVGPGGATSTTTVPGEISTTVPTDGSTTTIGLVGIPGDTGGEAPDGDNPPIEALGDQPVTAAAETDWLRAVWWVVLVGSLIGLAAIAVTWRRRPTEWD